MLIHSAVVVLLFSYKFSPIILLRTNNLNDFWLDRKILLIYSPSGHLVLQDTFWNKFWSVCKIEESIAIKYSSLSKLFLSAIDVNQILWWTLEKSYGLKTIQSFLKILSFLNHTVTNVIFFRDSICEWDIICGWYCTLLVHLQWYMANRRSSF